MPPHPAVKDQTHCREVTQLIPYCDFCHKDFHVPDQCREKHPHLKAAYEKARADKAQDGHKGKRRRGSEKGKGKGGNNKDDKPKKDKDDEEWGTATLAYSHHPAFAAMAISTPHTCLNGEDVPAKHNFSERWVLDSGCNQHMAGDPSAFTSFTPLAEKAIGGVGGNLVVTGIGSIRLYVKTRNGPSHIIIHNVWYVPNSKYNLLSYSMLKNAGVPMAIKDYGFEIGSQGARAVEDGGLYFLVLETPTALFATSLLTLPTSVNEATYQMWHERLGHLGQQNVLQLANQGAFDLKKPPPQDACVPCARGAGRSEGHSDHIAPGRWEMDLIHADIMGPLPGGYNDARYICTWLDDKTKRSHTDYLTSKASEGVFTSFKNFLSQNEHGDNKCTRIRIDNGSEYLEGAFQTWRENRGIKTEPITAGNPEMNGCAERLNQTLMRKTSTMLKDAGLPEKWWPEVVTTANLYRNISPVAGLKDKTGRPITPFEASTGHMYNYSHIRRVGQLGEALNTKPSTGWKKLTDHTKPMVLVGYEGEHIYRMIDWNNKIKRVSSVYWLGHKRPSEHQENQTNKSARTDNIRPVQQAPSTVPSTSTNTTAIDRFLDALGTQLDEAEVPVPRQIAPVRSRGGLSPAAPNISNQPRQRRAASPSDQLSDDSDDLGVSTPTSSSEESTLSGDTDTTDTLRGQTTPTQLEQTLQRHPELRARRDSSVDPLALLTKAMSPEPYEPKTYEDAMKDAFYKMEWQLAMDTEVDSHIENCTWEVVAEAPSGRHVLRGKWVYKLKRGIDGKVVRFKARWVVRGFEQREGLDYNETFAAVVKPMSYKAIFAIAAANDWDLEQMDVITAFLYGDVEEEIYVELPTGYKQGTKICRLRKALYGLKQSPRVWYNTLASFLKEHGFVPLDADLSVFSNGKLIIAIYVDDILLTGPNSAHIAAAKRALNERFKMTDLGSLRFYLGMGIERDRSNRILFLSQKAYLEKVLKDHGMWECKPVATPMDSNALEAAGPDHVATAGQRHAYQSAVGSLMYAMLGTRPDLAYAVSVVSRYASNPTGTHWKAVKRIFRYIRGTLDLRLTFSGALEPLAGYTDADWGGDRDTRRSTSGYVFNVGSGAISWSSKRQPTVALSTCEAEYMGQTQAAKEAIWLSRLLEQINPSTPTATKALIALGSSPSQPVYSLAATIIYCDNQGAVALAKNPTQHSRTKHIGIQQHFVREKVTTGEIELQYVPTAEQVADGLTKPLSRDKFESFRRALGLE